MKIIYQKNKNKTSVILLFLIHCGSRNEDKKELGIAHVVEHSIYKGTIDYPSNISLMNAINSIGGTTNAFTSYEYTG